MIRLSGGRLCAVANPRWRSASVFEAGRRVGVSFSLIGPGGLRYCRSMDAHPKENDEGPGED